MHWKYIFILFYFILYYLTGTILIDQMKNKLHLQVSIVSVVSGFISIPKTLM